MSKNVPSPLLRAKSLSVGRQKMVTRTKSRVMKTAASYKMTGSIQEDNDQFVHVLSSDIHACFSLPFVSKARDSWKNLWMKVIKESTSENDSSILFTTWPRWCQMVFSLDFPCNKDVLLHFSTSIYYSQTWPVWSACMVLHYLVTGREPLAVSSTQSCPWNTPNCRHHSLSCWTKE